MSKSVSTPVSAKTVRAAFAAKAFEAPAAALPSLVGNGPRGARGRLHPAAREAFEAAHPGFVVAEKTVSDEPTVEIVPVRQDKAGRTRRLKARQVAVSEVRALAGTVGKRGRLGKVEIAAAAEALGRK